MRLMSRGALCLSFALAVAPASAATFSGYYRIMARHSGKAVVVQGASTANGADVIQWTYGGSNTNDEWSLTDIGSGYFQVSARHSGKAMVVQSASTSEGADVIQWAYGGTNTNDEWQVVDLGTGYHRLTARHSGKALEVTGAGTGDGADVVQRTYSRRDAPAVRDRECRHADGADAHTHTDAVRKPDADADADHRLHSDRERVEQRGARVRGGECRSR